MSETVILRQTFYGMTYFTFWASVILAQGEGVSIRNTSEPLGKGRYHWTVYIDAPDTVMDRIASVEYTLHPTFPDPVVKVTSKENKFALSANGWGEFTIFVKVFFSNGKVGSYQHWLNLKNTGSKANGGLPPSLNVEAVRLSAANTAASAGKGRWDWSIFIEATDDVLSQIKYVEYTLHPSFPNPLRRITDRGNDSGKGFFLSANGWGVFEIAIKVMFKNGKARYLRHQLKFSED